MAASACMDAKVSAGELNMKTLLENGVFGRTFPFDGNPTTVRAGTTDSCRVWNGGYRGDMVVDDKVGIMKQILKQTPPALTLRAGVVQKEQVFHCKRRLLRIERATSTESVVATSGGESCQSSSVASDSASEPSSPSRPVSPQPMPPVPAHLTDVCPYECLRADSEDSGLGPSPAKSSAGSTSPLEGYVSPIQFIPEAEDADDEEERNPLLDLSACRNGERAYGGRKEGFLPYSVSKLMGQERNGLCQRANGRIDSFRFGLSRSQMLLDGLKSADAPGTARNALDFQFLMTSNSAQEELGGVAPSDASDVKPVPVEDDDGVPSLLPPSPSSSIEETPLSSPSSPLGGDAKDESDAKYSSCSRESPRHKVPHSAEDDTKSDPKDTVPDTGVSDVVVVVVSKRDIDVCDESRQSSCGDACQDRSEMCNDLTSDCTSSSCSQVTNDTQCSAGSAPDDNTCKWLNCDQRADANANSSDLVDHLRKCHVQNQFEDGQSYVCLWVGCKVYDRPSSSRSWLERHVLLHGGSKPFRCIVDGCHQRFGSEVALQRHVNSHFPQSNKPGKNGPHGEHHNSGPGTGGGPNGRLLKRKKLHKCRRRPHSVKTNDFFDDGIMEQVRHSLFELSSIEGMDRAGPPAAITFHSSVIARRTEGSGKIKLLLHWDPEDLLPDCWVAEEEASCNFQKTIPISNLPPETLVHLDPVFAARLLPRPGKRRRK